MHLNENIPLNQAIPRNPVALLRQGGGQLLRLNDGIVLVEWSLVQHLRRRIATPHMQIELNSLN